MEQTPRVGPTPITAIVMHRVDSSFSCSEGYQRQKIAANRTRWFFCWITCWESGLALDCWLCTFDSIINTGCGNVGGLGGNVLSASCFGLDPPWYGLRVRASLAQRSSWNIYLALFHIFKQMRPKADFVLILCCRVVDYSCTGGF